MKDYKDISTLCAVLIVVGVAGAAVRTTVDNGSYPEQFAAQSNATFAAARASETTQVRLVKNGMEPNSAGFHIVNPPRTPFRDSSDPFGVAQGPWEWFSILAAYPETAWKPVGATISLSGMFASAERVAPNSIATLSKFQSAGGWGITGTFSQSGMAILARIHGPTYSNVTFTDWAGILHVDGGNSSVMEVALVTNGTSLLPFSVTDLSGLAGPQVVTLAEGLTEAEVDQVLASF